MPDGAYIIKLLFSTVSEPQLPTVANALEWDADIFVNGDPVDRNKGPIEKFERQLGKIRLIQIDVSVRDTRSLTGWLMGTFGYDARAPGDTPWERMVPLGIQWGNSPTVTYAETCSGPDGPCSYDKLTEQWINLQAVKDLATPPLNFNHLGFGGRLAGPVDNPKASCMGCHQTAGFPNVPILPEFGPNASASRPRCPEEAGAVGRIPHDVLWQRPVRHRLHRPAALFLGLFAATLDEPAELRLAALRRRGVDPPPRRLRTTRPMGRSPAECDPRPADLRQPGSGGGPIKAE